MPVETLDNGTVVAMFGSGDILVTGAKQQGESTCSEVCLILDKRQNPVGARVPAERWTSDYQGRASDEVDARVRLVFDGVDGLDVLLVTLLQVRAEMTTGQPEIVVSDERFALLKNVYPMLAVEGEYFSPLEKKLVEALLPYAGERNDNEGALACATRIIRERDGLRAFLPPDSAGAGEPAPPEGDERAAAGCALFGDPNETKEQWCGS